MELHFRIYEAHVDQQVGCSFWLWWHTRCSDWERSFSGGDTARGASCPCDTGFAADAAEQGFAYAVALCLRVGMK